jgi:Flp pilus assembly protein TadD
LRDFLLKAFSKKNIIIAGLFIVTLVVFMEVRNNGFINYDDGEYIYENPHVQSGLTIKGMTWSLTTTHTGYWHPLTWFSHMMDVQLFGIKPAGHHLMSLLLHVANTLLLFLILDKTTRAVWQSAFVACLFAIHPLHVESVAWISERKDVLSTFFWMLTVWTYIRYVQDKKRSLLAWSCFFFALGLTAKPMLVTLPFLMLLLDYWPLRRYTKVEIDEKERPHKKDAFKKKKVSQRISPPEQDTRVKDLPSLSWSRASEMLKEKIPFIVLSAAISIATLAATTSQRIIRDVPILDRLSNACLSYVMYMRKIIWPADLAVLYPYPESVSYWRGAGAALILAAVSCLAVRYMKRFPYWTVGWFWYLGTLLPVIGVIQAGAQAMADRYTYVPAIGLFIIAAWGISDLSTRLPRRKILLASMSAVLITTLMMTSWKQVRLWIDDLSLFQHALAVTENNDLAHVKVGVSLAQRGQLDEARAHFEEAIHINPAAEGAHNQLGIVLASKGKLDEAAARFTEALRLKPDHVVAYNNLGIVFLQKGDLDAAIEHFKASLHIKPEDPEIHFMLGRALMRKGLREEALLHFKETLRINPDHVSAMNEVGIELAKKNQLDAAIVYFKKALSIQPGFAPARDNLQVALKQKKRNGRTSP